ncbi:hypothetical protein QYE76_005904 [Lolium multiflorum]|uniref:CCHC-type domain-containing protein n=1 Tax=Lolium multiflorum TaxID=4521 RepID=A0AAD8RVS3_LOLMU|nr:hypothetical protein QYE76_005904 [Lolium multiflorum]
MGLGGPPQPTSPLYKEGRGQGAHHPFQTKPWPPPLSSIELFRLGEALQLFSSTTTTTPSCCWDSEGIYHTSAACWNGERMGFIDTIMAAPTINFNQFLEKEKLKSNGSNFTDWFHHVRIFLTGGNLQYVLDAPLGAPPAENAPDEVKNVYQTRKTQYSQVQCAILCSLEAELQKRFESHDPCELVRELKAIFETHAAVESYEASKHFFGCMMEQGSSVSEHVLKMSGHAKKLSDLGIVIPNQLVLMVNKTTSSKKQGKPNNKGNFKKGGKKVAAPPKKPKAGPKPDTVCFYCKEEGHWKRNCPKYLANLKSGHIKKKGIFDIHVIDVYLTDNNDEDPATYEEAMMSPDSNKWHEAMKSEMGSMYDNQMDVKTAFLNGDIEEELYMVQPKGFVDPKNADKSGYMFILNGAAVSWMSAKQCTVAKSSTESEYIAASEASSEAIWMKRFITELGVVPSALDPLVIYCDNMGAIANAQEPRSHKMLKHIKLRFHVIRDASTELWRIIEEGYSPRDPKHLTRREVVDDQLNATAINMIHMAVTPKDRAHIRSLKTAKEAWDKLDKLFLGNESIQSSRFDEVNNMADNFVMNEGESPEEMYRRLIALAVQMQDLGATFVDDH